jgi:hypothetical protein
VHANQVSPSLHTNRTPRPPPADLTPRSLGSICSFSDSWMRPLCTRAGNEPDILAPWLFAFAGAKYHNYTVHWTRWLVDHAYGNTPRDGLPGNDDFGTLSAWASWAMLGFYPLAGSSKFALGAPRFESVRIRRDGGDLCVMGHGASQSNLTRVVRCELNGKVLTEPFFDWKDLHGPTHDPTHDPTLVTSPEVAQDTVPGRRNSCADTLEFWMGAESGSWG